MWLVSLDDVVEQRLAEILEQFELLFHRESVVVREQLFQVLAERGRIVLLARLVGLASDHSSEYVQVQLRLIELVHDEASTIGCGRFRCRFLDERRKSETARTRRCVFLGRRLRIEGIVLEEGRIAAGILFRLVRLVRWQQLRKEVLVRADQLSAFVVQFGEQTAEVEQRHVVGVGAVPDDALHFAGC